MTIMMDGWVRLPTDWINKEQGGVLLGLHKFKWSDGGSNNTAALMLLIAIAHHADKETGVAVLTYDRLCMVTNLSRKKVSDGLKLLVNLEIITSQVGGRSEFRLLGYGKGDRWGKLPARSLYSGRDRIVAFDNFHLRSRVEMNALKLYLLFIARRGEDTNMANISYNKIQLYTGIDDNQIKSATSFLSANYLVYVEHAPSSLYAGGSANAYRIVGIDSRNHLGTASRHRGAIEFDVDGA